MDNSIIKISIIIPAYNCEKYIKKTLESILNQTYPYFEVIIINDHSSDGTELLLEELSTIDDRIKVFKNDENLGSASTRNKGVELASYEWIALIDADDCWEREKLEKQVELIQNNPDVRFVFTGSAFMDSNGNRLSSVLSVPEMVDFKKVLGQNIISCSSVLVWKNLLIKHPMPNGKQIHEDYATWLMILETGITAYGINEPLLIYRMHAGSKSANKIKAAVMHWNCYSFVHCSLFKKVRGMLSYIVLSIFKFAKIR